MAKAYDSDQPPLLGAVEHLVEGSSPRAVLDRDLLDGGEHCRAAYLHVLEHARLDHAVLVHQVDEPNDVHAA